MRDDNMTTCFVDSNIWLYAFIKGQDVEKSVIARDLIRQNDPVVSTQVINEVCVNLLRKANFSEEQIDSLINSFYKKYRVVEPNRGILLTASELRQRYSLSFWDSIIVSSAFLSDVPILYSEDMQDGLVIDNRLHIINPLAQES